MRPKRLDGDARAALLQDLEAAGWHLESSREAVSKTFRFADFSAAFGWMTRVALVSEKLDHHPEWRNVWNRVDVTLTTHDAKGLTVLDADLAKAMDDLAQ